MTKLFNLYPLLFLLLVLSVSSCDDDDPVIENEEEVITRVDYTLTPRGDLEPVTFFFVDSDGDGGNDPVITQSSTLAANTVYDGEVSFSNEEEEIDTEILAEATDHQVFYQFTDGLTVAYAGLDSDTDANGNPIGLKTVVTTGAAGSGDLTITLRHQPSKSGATISDPTGAGGSTDAEVVFPFTIQ